MMNKSKVTKITLYSVLSAAIIAFIICSYLLVSYYLDSARANKINEDARHRATSDITQPDTDGITTDIDTANAGDTFTSDTDTDIVTDINTESDTETEPAEQVVIPVDFDSLWETNSDIIAWINVPGTIIDYPVCQSTESNDYYIRRGLDGKKLTAGTLFIENYNTPTFNDFNTVIYGHKMRDGTMFADLAKFYENELSPENAIIYIYTPTAILEYKIFAVYVRDSKHLLYGDNFDIDGVITDYIAEITTRHTMSDYFDPTVSLTHDDKIITLSTCSEKVNRLIVHGVLCDVKGEIPD